MSSNFPDGLSTHVGYADDRKKFRMQSLKYIDIDRYNTLYYEHHRNYRLKCEEARATQWAIEKRYLELTQLKYLGIASTIMENVFGFKTYINSR